MGERERKSNVLSKYKNNNNNNNNKKPTSILVIVLPKYFPHGTQISAHVDAHQRTSTGSRTRT